MFVAYICHHKYHSDNRKVEPVFGNDFVLNLITKRMSDEEVDALQKGIWLCETERKLKDKNGDPFRICKPVRMLDENCEIFCQPYVRKALEFSFSEDAEAKCQRFEKEMKVMLGRRISTKSGCNYDTVWSWVKEQLESGAISLDILSQWVSEPVPVEWDKARLVPYFRHVRSGDVDSVLCFRDINSSEDETLEIRAYNLDKYRSVIPEYVKLTKNNAYRMNIEILLNKVASTEFKVDPLYGDVLAEFQQTGAFWLTVTPYADRPDVTFEAGIKKTSVNFPSMLKKHGISEINGQYVPESTPDWTIKKIEGYRPEDGVYKVMNPHTCMVQVAFTNGMSGRYPLVYMMKRYPGKCLNASFAVNGYSLDSMLVTVKMNQ